MELNLEPVSNAAGAADQLDGMSVEDLTNSGHHSLNLRRRHPVPNRKTDTTMIRRVCLWEMSGCEAVPVPPIGLKMKWDVVDTGANSGLTHKFDEAISTDTEFV